MSRSFSFAGEDIDATDFKPASSVFYLDVSENVLVPKLIKYIQMNGGQCSPFLDKNVTHLVTDKAKTMAEAYPRAQKWKIAVWSVEQFATVILNYMDQKGTKVTSPTLHRVVSRKRDLSMCLEEEKRNSLKSAKANTPQYAHVRPTGSLLGPIGPGPSDGIAFVPLDGHYVLIEDIDGYSCPIFKEYPVMGPNDSTSASHHHFKVPRMPYPMFYWDSPIGQCPFIPPLANANAHPQPAADAQVPEKENVRKEGAIPPVPLGPSVPLVHSKDPLHDVQMVNGAHQVLPLRPIVAHRALRRQHQRPSLPPSASAVFAPIQPIPDGIVFEPAMTDTSILTAKTHMTRCPRVVVHKTALPNEASGVNFGTNSLIMNDRLSVPANISVSVSRNGAAPSQRPSPGNLSPSVAVAVATATATATAAAVDGPIVTGRGSLRKQSKAAPAIAATTIANAPGQTAQNAAGNGSVAAAKAAPQPRIKPGFCECCCEKYSDLDRHIRTESHRQYAQDSDHYEGIDKFLGTLRRTLRPDFLLAACKHGANGLGVLSGMGSVDEQTGNTSALLPPKSPLSPTTTTSHITAPRNYTCTKRMKQSLASKRLKMLATRPSSSSSAEGSSPLPSEDGYLRTTIQSQSQPSADVLPALLSSPSCKRRKVHRLSTTGTAVN